MPHALLGQIRDNQFPPTRILILGGGFGGVHTTLRLDRALRHQPQVQITLIDRENFLLFTPLLHEVATGGIETRHIAQPLRSLQKGRRFSFLHAEVKSVDLQGKIVHTDRLSLPYDFLVLALGGVPDTTHLPEAAPYLFFLKTLYDGMILRNHIITLFEEAATREEVRPGQFTFMVVGGGATGIQLMAEVRDLVFRFMLKNYPTIAPKHVRLLLVQDEKQLLPDMHPALAQYALSRLRKDGIQVLLNTRVSHLSEEGAQLSSGEIVPTATLVWTAGVRASPVVEGLPAEKGEDGRVRVNRYLEMPGYSGVYALGDNACFLDPRSGHPLPARAHIAVRQPRTVVHNIMADLSGQGKKEFRPPWMGDLIPLGHHKAAIKLPWLRLYGRMARAFWMASSLLLIPGWHARTRVAADWLLGLIFDRDMTLLRLPRL